MLFVSLRSNFAKRLFACLTVCSILFGAIAPTTAQAISAKRVDWVEVCTVKGVQWVALDNAPNQPADKHHLAQGQHCPFCGNNDTSVGLPPAVETYLPAHRLPAERSPKYHSSLACPSFAWASANPRAPPAISA